jgi:hypothetical protein
MLAASLQTLSSGFVQFSPRCRASSQALASRGLITVPALVLIALHGPARPCRNAPRPGSYDPPARFSRPRSQAARQARAYLPAAGPASTCGRRRSRHTRPVAAYPRAYTSSALSRPRARARPIHSGRVLQFCPPTCGSYAQCWWTRSAARRLRAASRRAGGDETGSWDAGWSVLIMSVSSVGGS